MVLMVMFVIWFICCCSSVHFDSIQSLTSVDRNWANPTSLGTLENGKELFTGKDKMNASVL